ncbi:hypothetical protein SDC9_133191 [bioreactor metagenome]|uniref:Uncharacterized protein n=1 Tax=bioreactor metagenome TaxID=1076179 RepID=A0A645DAK7_9ZZZZ
MLDRVLGERRGRARRPGGRGSGDRGPHRGTRHRACITRPEDADRAADLLGGVAHLLVHGPRDGEELGHAESQPRHGHHSDDHSRQSHTPNRTG